MYARILATIILAAAGGIAGPCLAKGITIQLTITGPGYELPIQTTDKTAISAIVWGTNFFELEAGPVPRPDESLPRFNVYFWVRLPNNSIEMKYVISYVWAPNEGYAVVCFPGRQDPWYWTNVGSILRKGIDGNCYRAEDRWGRAVKEALS